jgi:hypothetical protein
MTNPGPATQGTGPALYGGDASGGSTLGASSASLVGFYGVAPVAQRASTSVQRTSNLSTVSGTISVSTAALNQVIASLQEVMNTLAAVGLWSIS